MDLFEIFFKISYCCGLYPFYYDKGTVSFKFTKTSLILKFAPALIYVLFFIVRLYYIYLVKIGVESKSFEERISNFVNKKYVSFIFYWTLVQFLSSLYCIYLTLTRKNIKFLNNYLSVCLKILKKPKATVSKAIYFLFFVVYETTMFLHFCIFIVK